MRNGLKRDDQAQVSDSIKLVQPRIDGFNPLVNQGLLMSLFNRTDEMKENRSGRCVCSFANEPPLTFNEP